MATTAPPTTDGVMRAFSARLAALVDSESPGVGRRVDEVAFAAGTDRTRIYAWMRGSAVPNLMAVVRIARHYGISMDDLTGAHDG